jgi:septal ring factor EnvC (AmiA/AmiB activator)
VIEQATSPARASTTPKPSRRRAEPQRVPSLTHLSLTELRAYREELTTEETRVSYWRRILQARHDLIVDNCDPSGRDRLRDVLADHEQKSRRLAVQTMHDPDLAAPLPELAELWDTHTANLAAGASPDRDLIARLEAAEQKLSAYRRSLHERLDEVTADLVARYREQPALALVALNFGPTNPSGPA